MNATKMKTAKGEDVQVQTWLQAPGLRSVIILRHAHCPKSGEFLMRQNIGKETNNQIWACEGCGAEIALHAKA